MIYVNGRFLTQNMTGTQRFAYEIVKYLTSNIIDITVLMPPENIAPCYNSHTFKTKKIGKRSGVIWEQIDLARYIIKYHKGKLLINLVNTAPLLYKHQIVTIHDMTVYINPGWFSKGFVYYYKFLLPIIVKRCIRILTVSECSKKDIIRFFKIDGSKISIVSNSVSGIFTNPAILNINADILNKLNIKEKKYILSVSSIDPRKNFFNLIKAYQSSQMDFPLIIIGSKGKVFSDIRLEKLIGNAENVVFTGYLNDKDVAVLYNKALFFVYPSLYEGFGIPPLEAMACNCPTIVSNVSSLPEVCGEASLYFDPYDTSSIVDAIDMISLDENLRKKLILLGKQQVKKFSWTESGLKLKNVIEKLI